MPEYAPDDRLREAHQAGLGQRIPEPLHTRVDQLCDLVYDTGRERPGKAKMIAALLLAAEPDAVALTSALDNYDRARIRDALLDASDDAPVQLPARRSGPRRPGKR